MFDIEKIRDIQIEAFGLDGADREYVFYHDETNNIKKLRVKENRFNVLEQSVFVLGGIVHTGAQRALNVQSLRDSMRIQRSAPELKFKHVASGDFLEALSSSKLNTFLQWVSDCGLDIHYHALDPIHWAVVDIIDSILYGLRNHRFYPLHLALKADLTAVLRVDLDGTASIFQKYRYPNLAPESRKPFLDDLLGILDRSDELPIHPNGMILKGMLQTGRDLPNLEFIEDFAPHELIDSFAMFYVNRIALFKNAFHILDNEDSVEAEIEAMGLSSGGKRLDQYKFADSKTEPGIQISDIVVGLIGKMHTWLVQTRFDEVVTERASLQGVALKNAELLRDLVDASHDANIAFLHHVMSTHDVEKMNVFLRNSGGRFEVEL